MATTQVRLSHLCFDYVRRGPNVYFPVQGWARAPGIREVLRIRKSKKNLPTLDELLAQQEERAI